MRALSPSTSSMALIDIPHSQLEALGYTDGNLHELRWEIRVGDGFSHPGVVKVWIDDVFVAESNTTEVDNRLEGNWTSTRAGGFGRVSNQICRGEHPTPGHMKLGLLCFITMELDLWSIKTSFLKTRRSMVRLILPDL